MGILDRFSGLKSIFGKSKDFNINEKLQQMYNNGVVADSYNEILKLTDKKFKETLDINDQILEKYAKDKGEDIQSKVMQQYLKDSQDDILQEQQELNQEVDEATKDIEGVDDATREQIKKDLEEEEKENKKKGIVSDDNKSKEALQKRIYEATYNRMYKDYTNKVMNIKNAQYDSMEIGLGTEEAITIIAMEKNLEKLDLLYKNHTGKDISKVKKIEEKKKDFKSEFEYTQRGVEANTDERARKIEMLYKIRTERYEKYIKALKNPSCSELEKYQLKRHYEEANLDLIQSIPSIEEYTKDIEIQGDNEKMAKDARLKESAINSRIQGEEKLRTKVTETRTVENIQNIREEEIERDSKALEHTQIAQKDAMKKGDYSAARQMDVASQNKRIYDRNIENTPQQSTISETKKDVKEHEDVERENFLSGLRAVNDVESKSAEELQKIVDDREHDVSEKIKENMYKEQLEQENEQRIRKQNKKPNG